MRLITTTALFCTLATLPIIEFSSPLSAQELIPPPVPAGVDQAAAAASNALNSISSSPLSAGVGGGAGLGGGVRPGGFFHALSTATDNVCEKIKASPIGAMIRELRKPLSSITGGLVPATSAPGAKEMAAPGPAGTAAQIQALKLDGPKRAAAIAELKGLDIRYHPEVTQTLIAALRADPSECVRLEAARTIATLRTCTKPLTEALRICVEGTEKDGNPAELSPTVQRQAAIALNCCLSCLAEGGGQAATDEQRPEYPVTPASFDVSSTSQNLQLTTYYQQIETVDRNQIARAAYVTLNRFAPDLQSARSDNPLQPIAIPANEPTGLFEIWKASRK